MLIQTERFGTGLADTLRIHSQALRTRRLQRGEERVAAIEEAGQIMADAVAGTMERFDLFADVKPFVVPGATVFNKPMVTLGVFYYQIKDRL